MLCFNSMPSLMDGRSSQRKLVFSGCKEADDFLRIPDSARETHSHRIVAGRGTVRVAPVRWHS
jgi:hypothetical protein